VPKWAFAGLVHQAKKLPTFEAALTRPFRFVSTVTILQQTIRQPLSWGSHDGCRKAADAGDAKRIATGGLPKS
jgi:hypothetical protein